MNKVSTAVYMLIALLVIVLAVVMAKPVLVDAANKEVYQIKLLNFKALGA